MKIGRLIVGAVAGLALSVTAALAEKTTLRISLQLPMKSHLGQNLQLFKDEVEKNSNGDITVEIYDSAQLYKDNEVPQAVGSGAIEMGVASLTRYVGDIPAVDVFYMPFLLNSEELVRKAVAPDSPVRGPIDAAIEETGSKVLWWQAYGGVVLLSNGGPVKTPEDVKGKKVRVFGKTLGTWIEAAGGAPTLISGSEQYIAYQRGTVDIGMTGVSGVKSRNLWEVMDTITVTNNADIEFIVVVNKDFWEGLPEEHKEIIQAAALKAENTVRDEMSNIEAAAFDAARENGMTVYEPTEEEIDAWKAAAQPVYDQYLAASGDLGAKILEAARGFQN
ncbi:C4-dicarboxylate ABC transporter substrate-binding protein [Stappia sp. GBMRC 2046]|uniref:C4-dicarboxylate ABC transporter substrate-binding protein n=1 Tax=Stappia sediminis TaxID=2692190 RepID=A0A7X3LW65_9HYPH|nr:TRAP transporter substrate-binding protein DctP [Stappia sediminis]MXN66183.1 C4-dicarboxylate ABC transporter substrate-binding protein [Stappia sediminis]